MVVVDTSVWIDYFRGVDSSKTKILDSILDVDRIGIGDLIIAEILQGFKSKKDINTAIKIIDHLEYFNMVGKEIAIKSAQNYRTLTKKGYTVRKTIDVLIGTFCIENNFQLLHNDKDFNPMEKILGLQILS